MVEVAIHRAMVERTKMDQEALTRAVTTATPILAITTESISDMISNFECHPDFYFYIDLD